jgi:flagellar P-ring protein precursor FlgI
MNQGNITVANITRALNKLGATPKEIIAIIENLKRAGAIQAGVEVI